MGVPKRLNHRPTLRNVFAATLKPVCRNRGEYAYTKQGDQFIDCTLGFHHLEGILLVVVFVEDVGKLEYKLVKRGRIEERKGREENARLYLRRWAWQVSAKICW